MTRTRKYRNIALLWCLSVLSLSAFNRALAQSPSAAEHRQPEPPPTLQELLEWREVFTYNVRYSFFNLGKVQTTVLRDTAYGGERLWWLRTKIISDPSIPFMGKEVNHYHTFFVATDSLPYTRLYWRDNVDEEEFNAERYIFDYDRREVFFLKNGEPEDTLELSEPSTAGHLLFYYSRLLAGTDRHYSLPAYVGGEKGYIDVTNSRNRDKREYDAFEQPVDTYHTRGNAHIDGPFGFSGEFEAWFSAGELRIPVEAHARVWLGNVKIRLIDYKKERRNR